MAGCKNCKNEKAFKKTFKFQWFVMTILASGLLYLFEFVLIPKK